MIRRLMEDSRRVVIGGGKHYILWGMLISVALASTYFGVVAERPVWIMGTWATVTVVGWALSIGLGRRDHARAPVRSLAGRLLGGIWIGVGVTATLLGFLGMLTGAVRPSALSGVMALVLATGYFASSFVHDSTAMRWLAAVWWGGGVVMVVWPGAYTLLVFGAMLILFQVVPGVLLYRRSKRVEAGTVS